jgi:hypothetical protein
VALGCLDPKRQEVHAPVLALRVLSRSYQPEPGEVWYRRWGTRCERLALVRSSFLEQLGTTRVSGLLRIERSTDELIYAVERAGGGSRVWFERVVGIRRPGDPPEGLVDFTRTGEGLRVGNETWTLSEAECRAALPAPISALAAGLSDGVDDALAQFLSFTQGGNKLYQVVLVDAKPQCQPIDIVLHLGLPGEGWLGNDYQYFLSGGLLRLLIRTDYYYKPLGGLRDLACMESIVIHGSDAESFYVAGSRWFTNERACQANLAHTRPVRFLCPTLRYYANAEPYFPAAMRRTTSQYFVPPDCHATVMRSLPLYGAVTSEVTPAWLLQNTRSERAVSFDAWGEGETGRDAEGVFFIADPATVASPPTGTLRTFRTDGGTIKVDGVKWYDTWDACRAAQP